MAKAPGKARRKEREESGDDSWLLREVVGEYVFAPLVRGALWLVLHAALLVKRLLTP